MPGCQLKEPCYMDIWTFKFNGVECNQHVLCVLVFCYPYSNTKWMNWDFSIMVCSAFLAYIGLVSMTDLQNIILFLGGILSESYRNHCTCHHCKWLLSFNYCMKLDYFSEKHLTYWVFFPHWETSSKLCCTWIWFWPWFSSLWSFQKGMNVIFSMVISHCEFHRSVGVNGL